MFWNSSLFYTHIWKEGNKGLKFFFIPDTLFPRIYFKWILLLLNNIFVLSKSDYISERSVSSIIILYLIDFYFRDKLQIGSLWTFSLLDEWVAKCRHKTTLKLLIQLQINQLKVIFSKHGTKFGEYNICHERWQGGTGLN